MPAADAGPGELFGAAASTVAAQPFRPADDRCHRTGDGVRVVVRGGAAFGGQDLGERRRSGDHRGRAARQRLKGRQPERFVRPGCERDVGRRQDGRDGVAAADEAGEVDGQAGGLALEPGAHRALPDHDQPGVDTRITQRGNGIDAAMRVLLH